MASRDEKDKQDCWRFLTTGEKVLLFLLILTTLALLTLFLTVIVTYLSGERVCHASNCVVISAKLLNLIDFEQEPCNNFNKFICHDQSTRITNNDITTRKKSILQKLLVHDHPTLVNPIKFYKSCRINDDNRMEALNLIIEKLQWPLLLGQNWAENTFNWLKFMVKLRDNGLKYQWLLDFDWDEDVDGRKLLKISPPSLTQIPNSNKQACFATMLETALIFNSSKTIAREEMRKVRAFEDSLLALTDRAGNQSIIDFYDTVLITVDELNTYWPDVDLIFILNDLSKGYTVFTRNTTIMLNSKDFLMELNGLLARTPRRIQADYLIWKTIEDFGPYLPDALRELFGKYLAINTREAYCFDETFQRFHYLIDQQYIDEFVTNDTRTNIGRIVDFVTETDDFTVEIGDLDSPINSDLDFVSDNIIDMILQQRYEQESNFFKCLNTNRTCDNPGQYREDSVNQLALNDNTIHIPNSMLQSDYYNYENPNYLNYAGLGYKIIELLNGTDNNLEAVYLAYVRWSQRYQVEDQLPGLHFNPKQLFWIWSGYLYCNHDNNNTVVKQLTQSEYFMDDFHCNR